MAWTTPRTWVASEIVTASVMNTHVRDNLIAAADRIQPIYKAADQTVNNSTVLVSDTHLKFTAVAGENYIIDMNLLITAASTASDFSPAFSFPTGTMSFSTVGLDTAAAATIASARLSAVVGATTGVSPVALSTGTISGTTGILIRAAYKCTTGGTVTFMWAQTTATAANTTVNQGSTLTAIRESI